jgi:hypothetical protein
VEESGFRLSLLLPELTRVRRRRSTRGIDFVLKLDDLIQKRKPCL